MAPNKAMKDMKPKTTKKAKTTTKAKTPMKASKKAMAPKKAMKDMKPKTTRKAKTTTKAKTARELDSEEHLSDDHFADDDFVDASDSQPESKAEKDEKKCFSEEHLKEMRMRYREYEFDAEIEALLAKHGK
jgi:hypothetical protein